MGPECYSYLASLDLVVYRASTTVHSRGNSTSWISQLNDGDDQSELIKLNSENYSSWKLQVRMALIRDYLWEIVNGTEAGPGEEGAAEEHKKVKI